MSGLYVESASVLAPGLAGWPASRAVLAGERPYLAEPMPAPTATLLPANERRRTTGIVKLALHVAQEAMSRVDRNPRETRTVFASSGGDSEVLDKICMALTLPDRPVSPTHFHQSVHNTPAGYWAIATGCTQASISLSAYDGSVAAGLLEAMALALAEAAPVLLVACDLPLPFPLSERRLITAPFGMALLLTPQPVASRLAVLQVRTTLEPATPMDDAHLESLRLGNPAARALPLLWAIARPEQGRVVLGDDCGVAASVEVGP